MPEILRLLLGLIALWLFLVGGAGLVNTIAEAIYEHSLSPQHYVRLVDQKLRRIFRSIQKRSR